MSKIAEISTQTGLAKSTVAAILRNAPGFNSKTRQRVLKVAQKLDYRPNYLSKALAGSKSMTIGAMIGSYDPSVLWKVKAIETEARKTGYLSYVTFAAGPTDGLSMPMAQSLLERKVDGLIVYSLGPPSDELSEFLSRTQIPVVYIDWAPRHISRRIIIDQDRGMQTLADHLANCGHRQVVFMGIDFDLAYPAHKIQPLQRALANTGVDVRVENAWTVYPDKYKNYHKVVYDTVCKHIKSDDAPTAIVTCDDEFALGIIAAVHDCGLRVPQDISVIGFDDHPIAQHMQPSLTTLQQPRGQVGLVAFQMLLGIMFDPGAAVTPITFESKLVIRNSTGPARKTP